LLVLSCNESFTPRPYGYFRIDLPQQTYTTTDIGHAPYSFDKIIGLTLVIHSLMLISIVVIKELRVIYLNYRRMLAVMFISIL
jgi:hypothetical protein